MKDKVFKTIFIVVSVYAIFLTSYIIVDKGIKRDCDMRAMMQPMGDFRRPKKSFEPKEKSEVEIEEKEETTTEAN